MERVATPIRRSVQIRWNNHALDLSFLERKNGAAWLLLLHGLQSDSSLFLPFFDDPRFSRFSLLAPDFVGFGQSAKSSDFTYDLADQAEIIKQLMVRQNIKQMIALGHSFGGMVATILLEDRDVTVERIVSLEGNLTEADCGESLKISKQTFEEFDGAYSKKAVPSHACYKTAISIVNWSRSQKLLRIFTASNKPKLLIVGDRSSFKSRPPKTDIEEISGAGHFLLVDQPESTMTAVARFLEK